MPRNIADWAVDKEDLIYVGIDVVHPQKLSAMENFQFKKTLGKLKVAQRDAVGITENVQNKHPSVVGVAMNKTNAKFGFSGK